MVPAVAVTASDNVDVPTSIPPPQSMPSLLPTDSLPSTEDVTVGTVTVLMSSAVVLSSVSNPGTVEILSFQVTT